MEYFVEEKREAGSVNFLYEALISHGLQNHVIASAHVHEYVELLFGLQGACRVDQNDAVYTFSKGDLIIINAQTIHQVTAVAEGASSYIVVKFKPELLHASEQTVNEYLYVLPFLQYCTMRKQLITKEELATSDIPWLFHLIYAEMVKAEYGFEMAVRSYIFTVLTWILRYWHARGEDTPAFLDMGSTTIKKLGTAFHYVDTHYSENISIADVAAACGMSQNTFSKVFRKNVNKSFNDYINLKRIKEAEKKLIFTTQNITEIAFETGYSSTSYFIQRFKEVRGMTPLAFRKRFNAQMGDAAQDADTEFDSPVLSGGQSQDDADAAYVFAHIARTLQPLTRPDA